MFSFYNKNIYQKIFNRCRCYSTNNDLPGGIKEENFIYLTEKLSPFVRTTFNLKVTSVKKGKLEFLIPHKKSLIGNPMTNALHGGVAAAIVDHAGGFSAWSAMSNPRLTVSTVDLRVDYLAPAKYSENEDSYFFVEANVIDIGSTIIRSDVILWNGNNKKRMLATGRGTFNIYEIAGDEDMNAIIEKVRNQQQQ